MWQTLFLFLVEKVVLEVINILDIFSHVQKWQIKIKTYLRPRRGWMTHKV